MTEQFKNYNGNPLIKKAGQGFEWTGEQVQEYMKCLNDPIYFIKTYMKVVHVDRGLVGMDDMYPYQVAMVNSIHENRNSIFTTARQAGKSTVVCAYILWYIIFNEDKTVALLANKGDTAREILGKVRTAYENLPKWLQQGVLEWNKGSVILENNSRVLAGSTSVDSIRGYSINLLVIDEAAHIENWDDFFTSTYSTLSSGQTTKIVLVSTPYGLNHFHKTWELACRGENNYNPIKVMWYDVPGRDAEWKKNTLAAMNFDYEKFGQEHECEFLGSSGTLIAGWKLKELVSQRPIYEHNGVCQYKAADPDHRYVVIVDVSEGKGLDYSAFQIIDVSQMPYEQVCTYNDNRTIVSDYTDIIHQMAKKYNDAMVLVETNINLGAQVCDILFEGYEYSNILYTENAGHVGKRITVRGAKSEKGVRTTKKVKNVGCSMLKMLIEQNHLVIHDRNTIEQLARFSRKANSYQAEPGAYDDLVMGLVLFAWMTDQEFFKELTDINTLSQLREKSDDQIMADLLPFGFIDDGRDLEDLWEPVSPMFVIWE